MNRFIPKPVSGFLDFARLLWKEATTGPNALNEARRREREAIVRWLRQIAPATFDASASSWLHKAANMIAGGAHYRSS